MGWLGGRVEFCEGDGSEGVLFVGYCLVVM